MKPIGWGQSWRLARRDMNRGLRGLRLLFICLFLGVATLAAIGSLTYAITDEIASRGQLILGGDIEVELEQREASDADLATFRQLGDVSETIRMRAMARTPGDEIAAVLTELKAVDDAYPLYGTLTLRGGEYRGLGAQDILVDEALARRLSVGPGDDLRYGDAAFTVRGIITEEPDRVGEGFTLGPVAIVSMAGLDRTGLVQPGSLFEAKYRIRLPTGTEAGEVRRDLERRFASAGWDIDDRENAAPGTSRFIERMGQFLSLIGLTALVIAGIGVGNGVSSYLGLKRDNLATLKILGATSSDIFRIYLIQVGVVSIAGIVCGLVAGAVLPPVIIGVAGDVLPVQPGFSVQPLPLLTSAIYGLLVALIFLLPPLARARSEPAAAIFRATLGRSPVAIDRRAAIQVGIAVALLIGIVLATARQPLFSASALGAIFATLAILFGLGRAISAMAARLPRPRRPLLRLAIANLHRPGAQTPALVVALGLALTLFVLLTAIQTSLTAEIETTVPEQAPSLFVLDIPSGEGERFGAIVEDAAPDAAINMVPALRGTVTAYGGRQVAELDERPDAFLLRGERGVTYSAELPEGSELVEGEWWPVDYSGPPLVSLDAEAAGDLDLGVGDTLTVSILGREIEARIASLRQINWDTMGFNYVMVFSPSALENAPHSLTATVTMDGAPDELTGGLLRAFPAASVIAVKEVVEQVRVILDQMADAITAAASITILAGIAVLVGSIAASRQARAYDSVILKMVGATRFQILGAQAIEYALLALAVSLLALGLGAAGSWFVMVQIFDFGWRPDWVAVLGTLVGGAALTLGIGLLGSIPLMSVRPASALRKL